MDASNIGLYDGALLWTAKLQGVLSTRIRSRSSQKVETCGRGFRASASAGTKEHFSEAALGFGEDEEVVVLLL